MTMCDVYQERDSGRKVVCVGDSHGMVTVSYLDSYEKATLPENAFDNDRWAKVGRMCPDCEAVVPELLAHWKTCKDASEKRV